MPQSGLGRLHGVGDGLHWFICVEEGKPRKLEVVKLVQIDADVFVAVELDGVDYD